MVETLGDQGCSDQKSVNMQGSDWKSSGWRPGDRSCDSWGLMWGETQSRGSDGPSFGGEVWRWLELCRSAVQLPQ